MKQGQLGLVAGKDPAKVIKDRFGLGGSIERDQDAAQERIGHRETPTFRD
jgi:hypothetical protein